MNKKITLKQIWNAINAGKTVCWVNESYEVHPDENNNTKYSAPTARGNEALRCSCVENYFGSYLSKSEIKNCFILNREPKIKVKRISKKAKKRVESKPRIVFI